MIKRLLRRLVGTDPDPSVALLVRELTEAAKVLEAASTAMKHARVTPVLITETRAAFRRARSIAEQVAAQKQVHVPDREEVVV